MRLGRVLMYSPAHTTIVALRTARGGMDQVTTGLPRMYRRPRFGALFRCLPASIPASVVRVPRDPPSTCRRSAKEMKRDPNPPWPQTLFSCTEGPCTDLSTRVAVAPNLVRIYREVLELSVPRHLLELVERLTAEQNKGQAS